MIITGRKAARCKRLTNSQKEANRLMSSDRAPVEHGFADLKNWRILAKDRMSARHATLPLRALLVPTSAKSSRWRMIT